MAAPSRRPERRAGGLATLRPGRAARRARRQPAARASARSRRPTSPASAYAATAGRASSATHVDGVRRGLRLPAQGHRAADLPAPARLPAAHGDDDRPGVPATRRSAPCTWRTRSPRTAPIAVGEMLDVTATRRTSAAARQGHGLRLRHHGRPAASELVWESTSTYLRRGKGDADAPSRGRTFDVTCRAGGVEWRLAGDLGRRYAAVSGDHNPIHLYPLTAKALGFPRQIAHGMWSKARCVAAIENRLPDAVTVEVGLQEAGLPAGHGGVRIPRRRRRRARGHRLLADQPEDGAPHLVGRARAGLSGSRVRTDQDRSRIRPSWATLATSRPSWVKTSRRPARDRPTADGECWS